MSTSIPSNSSTATITSSTTTSTQLSVESIVQQCGLLPLVAVLPSNGADIICKKNNIQSFADLISPFSSVACVVKDPYGQQQATKVKIDFRDISKSGCLLGLTVLPSVLHQVVSIVSTLPQFQSTEIWNSAFRDSFSYWFEPSDIDFLKTYLSCIFVISADEEDPIGELTKLIQQQHTQQHGGAESANSLGPAHCAPPKWFLPNILKYYVVLHDVEDGNEEKANEIFAKVSASYGSDCCQMLKINSKTDADLPDPWQQILEQRYRGLESGLEMARKKLMEKTASAESLADSTKPSSLVPLSTPNSMAPVFSTSSAATNPTVPLSSHYTINSSSSTVPQVANGPSLTKQVSIASLSNSRHSHGQCLTTTDREQLRDFVEKFIKQSLVPFVEKQITAQNDILQKRQGIGKSFTSMRKWLSAASSSTPTPGMQPISYGPESTEWQTRRLADMAFLFGMYTFSHQLYQYVKKDFLNDQAWLYHGGALEMAALTLYLSSNQLTSKNFPLYYLDNALNYFLNTCMQPMLAVRCAIISVEILSRIGMHLEAANQLIRLTSTLSDLFSGVLLEKASALFSQAKMYRRKAFHYVLAGHRFNQASQPILSLKCYDLAAPEYLDKGWSFAEDHIMFTLSHESKDSQYQAECATKLVKPSSQQFMDQQAAFIEHYLKLLAKNGTKNPLFVIPLIKANDIRIIYGEKPEVLPAPDDDGRDMKVRAKDDTQIIEWEDLERLAFHSGLGSKKPFKHGCPMFSDSTTKNREKKQTPPFERFRIQVKLINPMNVPLVLRNIRLGIKEIQMREGFLETDAFIEHGTIPELVLPRTELPLMPGMTLQTYPEHSETLIELHVIPTEKLLHFSISSILFDFCGSTGATTIPGHLPLEVKGRRLYKTKEQRMKKTYGTDNRLNVTVSEKKWPLLNIELSGQAARSPEIHAYSSQMFQVLVNFENASDVSISSITVSTDQPELVSISEPSDDTKWSLCSSIMNTNGILVHSIGKQNVNQLKEQGGKLTLRMAIKAPDEIVENKLYRILFFYIGENGNVREFRYSVKLTTQSLLRCVPKVLKENYQLCSIDIKNLIPNRDAVLAKVEVIRLSAYMVTAKEKENETIPIGIELVLKRNVVVECDQSDTVPFFINVSKTNNSSSTIWLTDVIQDIPSFNNIIPHYLSHNKENQQGTTPTAFSQQNLTRAHLHFSLLWRAQIANSDGTVATLFGETWIVNPFSIDKIQKFLNEPIEDERCYFSTGIPELNGRFAMVLLEHDRRSVLASKLPSYNLETKRAIHYRQTDFDNLKEINKEVSKVIYGKIVVQKEPIMHDFRTKSECRIPVNVEITNADPLQRSIKIWIYTCHELTEMKSPPLKEKVGDIESLEVSSISSQNRSQPKLSCDRACTHRTIEFSDSLNFSLTIKAYEPFCYNLADVIGAEIQFISNNNETDKPFHRLELQPTYIFIKSSAKLLSSRESTISPAMSMKSSDSITPNRFLNNTTAKTRVS
jgi:hypothetical protein